MNKRIRHVAHCSVLKSITVRPEHALTSSGGSRKVDWRRMKWRRRSQGYNASDEWLCQLWQTLQNKCKSNKHPVAKEMTAPRARSLASRMSAARAHARFMILEAHYPPYLSKHTHRRALARVPRPTDGILRKVNLWRVLWGCADNPLWWICSHSQSVILKAFWMRGRPPPIWNRNFINHLRWQTALRRASHWMGGNLLRMTIDAGLRVRLTGVAGTHFKLTLLPVKKLCHLAQTFILQQILVEEGRDYCRRRSQTLEIKEWIAIENFFFWLRPSIVLDESLNLLHSPLVEMRIFLHYLSFFFAEIVCFQTVFPFFPKAAPCQFPL